MKYENILFLSEEDVIKTGKLSVKNEIENAENVFRLLSEGDYRMGGALHNAHGLAISFPRLSKFSKMPLDGPDRRFVAMPAYLGGKYNVVGNKWYGSNTENRGKGLPRSILTLTLNDPETGFPLTLMSANLISSGRTGAVASVASKYLANELPKTLTLVGCGPVNKSCLEHIMVVHKGIKKINLYNYSEKNAVSLKKFIEENYEVNVVYSTTFVDLKIFLENSDVVSIAASRTHPLKIKNEWLKKRAVILLSGPVKADEPFWINNKIVFDHVGLHKNYYQEAKLSENKLNYYEGVIGGQIYKLIDENKLSNLEDSLSLGNIMTNRKKLDQNYNEKIIFVSCGMPVFDVGLGSDIYNTAMKMNIGKQFNLWK